MRRLAHAPWWTAEYRARAWVDDILIGVGHIALTRSNIDRSAAANFSSALRSGFVRSREIPCLDALVNAIYSLSVRTA